MIILPGPGIISIIVAVALADFPASGASSGRLSRWIVRTPLNAMRAKYGAPPIIIPEADGSWPPGTREVLDLLNREHRKNQDQVADNS